MTEQGEVETLVGSESHSTGCGFGSGLRFGQEMGMVEVWWRRSCGHAPPRHALASASRPEWSKARSGGDFLEAARSSSRGSNWALSGSTSPPGSVGTPGAARCPPRRRRSRARALRPAYG